LRHVPNPRGSVGHHQLGAGAAQAVQAIIRAAKTGKIGDGKVIISTLEDALRIRAEERGDSAV
jgi:nitrogen regulatory protein P-II 1